MMDSFVGKSNEINVVQNFWGQNNSRTNISVSDEIKMYRDRTSIVLKEWHLESRTQDLFHQ